MTRSEMKGYLEGIWEKWHNNNDYLWTNIYDEGILTEEMINEHYHGFSINSSKKEDFVNGFLRALYPTKLEKALR